MITFLVKFARRRMNAAVVVAGLLALAVAAGVPAASDAQKRADVDKMAQSTLKRLYAARPSAEAIVKSAAGYAVFRAAGAKIFVAGGGMGSGLAVDNRSKAKTYMKMAEVQAGLGLGIKKFRLIWIFEDRQDLDTFINSGWELGAQTTAAAKVGDEGDAYSGAISIKPGVWLYQLTDEGLALELTAKGTKYYKDDDLN